MQLLPTEVMVMVAKNLDSDTLRSLKLSSKHLNDIISGHESFICSSIAKTLLRPMPHKSVQLLLYYQVDNKAPVVIPGLTICWLNEVEYLQQYCFKYLIPSDIHYLEPWREHAHKIGDGMLDGLRQYCTERLIIGVQPIHKSESSTEGRLKGLPKRILVEIDDSSPTGDTGGILSGDFDFSRDSCMYLIGRVRFPNRRRSRSLVRTNSCMTADVYLGLISGVEKDNNYKLNIYVATVIFDADFCPIG
jgi:hypothetical protein